MTTSRPQSRFHQSASYLAAIGCASCAPVTLAGAPFAGFAAPKIVAVGDGPQFLAIDDINNDGILDFAVTNLEQGAVSVRIGVGDGTFKQLREVPVGPFPADIALGDIDHDGDLDLVTTRNPSGADGDGVVVLENMNGSSFRVVGFHPIGPSPETIELVDINGDGHLDVVVGVFNIVAILLGDGCGGFGEPTTLAAASTFVTAQTHDINKDGAPDIIAAGFSDHAISVVLNNGGGEFGAPLSFPSGMNPRAFAIGDFNDDGYDDIVVAGATEGSTGALFLMMGSGVVDFEPPVQLATSDTIGEGVGPWDVAIVDLNFDHMPDIAASNEASGDVSIFINNGAGGFDQPRYFAAGASARAIGVGDVNGDGSADLLVATLGSDSVVVLLNLTRDPIDLNGNGVIDGVDLAILLSAWGTDGVQSGADLNGDGIVNGADLAMLLANWSV